MLGARDKNVTRTGGAKNDAKSNLDITENIMKDDRASPIN